MDRQQAWETVNEFTTDPGLIRHMLAVEAAMRAYARHFGEDEDTWGIVGLLHDFDWQQNPDLSVEGHPVVGSKILRERGWPELVIRSILSHAEEYTGVPREALMDKVLYAVDELTGLITAVALVRPSKSIYDVDLGAIKRKWKDKAFARGANRQDIERGAADLGVPLDEHITTVLQAMQHHARELGLEGQAA